VGALKENVKIFVINAGSSSIKSQLLDASRLFDKDNGLLWHGQVNFHDGGQADFTSSPAGQADKHFTVAATDAESGYRKLFSEIIESDGPLASIDEIKAVGHRVVHGGDKYHLPTVVDDLVLSDLAGYITLAPTHEEANIRGIQIARSVFTEAKQIAVFDTGFHHTMPESSIVFAGPYSWFEEDKIRRFGFHGVSHRYCSHQAAIVLKRELKDMRVITCHIGNGGSLCAIKDGASIMTTMGYTPLDGLVMGNRSGAIDPGLIIALIDTGKYTAKSLSNVLNNESGLKGISGISNDMRLVLEASQNGSRRARLAVEIYVNSLASNIAALVPRLGRLDSLVFTGGIGENCAPIREAVCAQLGFFGCFIDEKSNNDASEKVRSGVHQDISTDIAQVRTLVVKTNEELAIARDCLQFLK
jgi:acetate kinase